MLPLALGKGLLGSSPQAPPRVPEGPAWPLDVQGRIRVAICDEATGRTDLRANGEGLLDPFAAHLPILEGIAAILGGERWGTASTRLPAHAALHARMTRKEYQPASWMDLFRPDLALAPFER